MPPRQPPPRRGDLRTGQRRRHVITGGVEIRRIFSRFKQEGRGVFIYLRDGAAGVPARSGSPEAAASELGRTRQWREIGVGAQILRDLGIRSIRLRTATPRTYVGLSGFGIEIRGYGAPF